MKSYTDIEQSKKLAEFLSIESADMCYKCIGEDPYDVCLRPYSEWREEYKGLLVAKEVDVIPCWSLVALLRVMICPRLEEYVKDIWDLTAFTDETLRTPIEIQDSKEPMDACVAMIEKLHELSLL